MSRVAIASYGVDGYGDHIASRGNEVVFDVARAALDDVGLTRDDVDAVVGCDQDAFNGVTVSFGMKACAAGSYGKPSTRIQNGGVYAIHLARSKILAGKADCVMIASEDNVRFDEKTISNISQDPLYSRPIGENYVQSYALLASHHLASHDVTEADYARAAAKNYRTGSENPWAHRAEAYSSDDVLASDLVAWPLRELETCPVSAGGGAIVLVSEEKAAELEVDPVWIDGAGLGSSRYVHRDMNRSLELPSLRAAKTRAYQEAGVTDPRAELDFVELFDPVPPLELLGYEALDLCADGDGAACLREGVTEYGGDVPVNLSGGAVTTNPLNTGGLYRTIVAAMQLRGEYPGVSLDEADRAVVTGGDLMLGMEGRTDGVLVLGTGAS